MQDMSLTLMVKVIQHQKYSPFLPHVRQHCFLPASVLNWPSLPGLFTVFPSLLVNQCPHFKLAVVMQRCSQIQTRCLMSFFISKQHSAKVSMTLTNFQAKPRRGRKIGSVWLRPFKSCSNNLHSNAARALPLCSEGREKREREAKPSKTKESVKGNCLSRKKHVKVYAHLPDLTPHCRNDTFLSYPTPGWEKISAAAHLLSEHSNSDYLLLQIPLSPLQRGTSPLEPQGDKVGAGQKKQVPLRPSSAYFSP